MPSSAKSRVALLDTNILDYGFKPRTKLIVAQFLEITARKYTLVISEYLRFEIYRGLAMERVANAKELVDAFTAYAVDKATLDLAAALTTCYEKDETTHTKRNGFSDGDLIMAATAFIHRHTLITANRMDFPAPYFEELKAHKFTDSKGQHRVFYELEPNVAYLNNMLDICFPIKKST